MVAGGNEFCHRIYTEFLLDVAALHAVGNLGHAWIYLANIFQLASGGLQFVEYAVVIAVQGIVGLKESRLDVLAVAQRLGFLFQLLQLSFLQLGIFQFLVLESHELLVFPVFEYLQFQVFQLNLCLMESLVFLLIGSELLVVMGDDVHHVELEIFLLQQQVLVL